MASPPTKYLVFDFDRHGNKRWYVRRRGQPKIRIRATEGSQAFLDEYKAAVTALPQPIDPRKHVPAVKGSFDELILAACNSVEWKSLDKETVQSRRFILEDWANTLGPKSGKRVGSVPAASITATHIRKRRDALSVKQSTREAKLAGKVIGRIRKATRARGGPAAANNFIKAVRAVFAWAVEHSGESKITVNPAGALKRVEYVKRQYHVWTPAELAAFREHWALGTKQRLAAELGMGTSQRPSDIRQLGHQHMQKTAEGYELHYIQHKGRKRAPMEMVTPVLPDLQAAIKAMPKSKTLIFVANKTDQPYSEHGFFNAFKDWCRDAGVPECSPHGLRILSAVGMLEAGISTERMMAWFGWRTIAQALHYAKTFNRATMNRETARMLVERTGNKSVPPFGIGEKSGTKTGSK